ncbi:hypothetical protein L6E12_08015 [Actinokineospora sp. PR83]|uniref:hypothetical protein n=1 Tax=Actinokineospora sp. PR83 TaxID=2884908 RepID=UPI001F2F3FA6|nr:hypothetical protein [Actinokineospora sp. PR83]MCG8915731.1 hypothetical protein [Actinokineospora sp. PR83]
MAHGDDDHESEYPIPSPAALEPPPEWAELRTRRPVTTVTLPTVELAVPAAELRRVEGLAVGGLRELPVRW